MTFYYIYGEVMNNQNRRKSAKLPAIIASVLILIVIAAAGIYGYNALNNRLENKSASDGKIDEVIEKAESLANGGDIEKAIAELEKQLKETPDNEKVKAKLEEYSVALVSSEQIETAPVPGSTALYITETPDVTSDSSASMASYAVELPSGGSSIFYEGPHMTLPPVITLNPIIPGVIIITSENTTVTAK